MRTPGNHFLFIAFLIVGFVDASDDWPAFRGPNYDGSANGARFSPENGNLTVSWRAKAGSGYSGVSIVGGKAVTAFTDGEKDFVAAYDSKSGKELWRYELSPKYAGHDGSHDGPIATPAIHDGKVFALSAFGDLTALSLVNGKKIWSLNVTREGGRSPFYGYTASPLVSNGVVVVQIGGEKGKSIAAFDQLTGKVKWTVGDDMVNYQSPILMKIDGKERIIAISDKKMFVVDAVNGKSVLEYDHGGDDAATILVPLPLDGSRLLLRNKEDSADLLRLAAGVDGKVNVEKVWTASVFKNSYNPPVYYNGHLYGFNGRILTCVNAENGETRWKTRAVPDGFVLLVNGNLIIQTKVGTVHVGPASSEGWKETKQVEVFKHISWTPPSYADGAIFSRSHGEVARVDISSAVQTASIPGAILPLPVSSKFASFMKDLESASDKKATVDQFFVKHKQTPIVEWPDRVIFLYRGAGDDIAIAGDIQGQQREDQMQRIAGTDLFYYSTRLEPDARINYRYVRNFEENIADPHNPRTTVDRRGNPMSWFAMPAWQEPTHTREATADKRGTFESHEIKSNTNRAGLAKVDVYLPAGYASSGTSYPVLYILDGQLAKSQGAINNTLENLSGSFLQPVILVFLTEIKTSEEPRNQVMEQTKQTSKYFVEEIVPFIDGRYRTAKERESRAIAGTLGAGGDAFYIAFENWKLFGGVATQSAWPMDVDDALKAMMTNAQEKPMRIYMDWGAYDARSKADGWDLRTANREFYTYLKEKGYLPAGGETHEGYGWGSWRNRNDRLLASLFPKM